MSKAVTLDEVLNLIKLLSPLDRVMLMQHLTQHKTRDLKIAQTGPR